MDSSDTNAELYKSFVQLHRAQLKSNAIPEIYWSSLFTKLKNEVFDAGNFFQLIQRVNEDDEFLGYKAICSSENGLEINDPNGIFLVDHAWTYRLNEARKSLKENENLLNRMCSLMNIKVDSEDSELSEQDLQNLKVEAVFENMWKFNQTYKLYTAELTDEEREPIWYVMDEFGSSIRHSDEPTIRCVPFYYVATGTMFSLIWPLQDLENGEEITRDFAYGEKDQMARKAKLYPWVDFEEDEDLFQSYEQVEPDITYFNTGKKDETLPDQEAIENLSTNLTIKENNNRLKVFTDLKMVQDHLTDERYEFVDDITRADIIFIKRHFKEYRELFEKSPNSLVNQFPFENVVTVKDLLAIVCRRVENSKIWLPITYNLSYELHKFIAYYKHRENENLDNHWIIKPWNLARSIDTSITKNLNQIIRSQETGPKIACKYITNPVLFYRDELEGSVKFDIRYIVLLRSVKPLVIYTYNVFWLRFANKPYNLDNLDEYEKHFTVMNYKPINLKQINYDEFIPKFEEQNPQFKWSEVQTKIFRMIREVFEGATKEKPPKGIASNYQSRAMYAVDLMLDWREENSQKTIEPMICEVNFMPDCTRACKFHPYFFNDIFSTLFLDNLQHNHVTQI